MTCSRFEKDVSAKGLTSKRRGPTLNPQQCTDSILRKQLPCVCLQSARSEAFDFKTKGLEDQLVNDVAQSSSWRTYKSWTFRKESHINILEMSSLLRLANSFSDGRIPLPVVNLVDSFVVRGAASKGRSA